MGDLQVSETCERCHGTGKVERALHHGDIVVPIDGSSMPRGIHKLLKQGGSFDQVRVLTIQGEMLGVSPIDTGNLREPDVYQALSPIWESSDRRKSGLKMLGEGFWIHYSMVKVADR